VCVSSYTGPSQRRGAKARQRFRSAQPPLQTTAGQSVAAVARAMTLGQPVNDTHAGRTYNH
jgi:hypothetical protein